MAKKIWYEVILVLDSKEEVFESFSELLEEAALGVTIFARESDLSLFETNLRVRKKAAARSNAANTNKIDTVFDFIFYKYIVNWRFSQ